MILFYLYPLKFLAQIVINWGILYNYFGIEFDVGFEGDVDTFNLFIIYGIGLFSIFFILALMYLHAYQNRKILNLDKQELEVTTKTILANIIACLVSAVSILLSVIKIPPWSEYGHIQGWIYIFTYPLILIAFFIKDKFYPSEFIAPNKS